MSQFIHLFKKYFLIIFFTYLLIQLIAFAVPFYFQYASIYEGEEIKRFMTISSVIFYWGANLFIGGFVAMDMKRFDIKNLPILILTLLHSTAGAILFLFLAYYKLIKTTNDE